jgi:hypothetical protein
MQRWEYCFVAGGQPPGYVSAFACTLQGIEVIYSLPVGGPPATPYLHERVHAWLGAQGWEACGFGETGRPAYFKRPL